MLKTRILSSLVLIPLVLSLSYLGGPYFAVLVTVVALLAAYEFYQIVRQAGHESFPLVGLALTALLMLDAYLPQLKVWRWAMVAAVVAPMLWQVLQGQTQGFLTGWALTLAGAFYVGGLIGHLILVRNLPHGGLGWLLLTFAGTWVCDSAAYLAGVNLGKHGFFTRISPRKTWEGAIGGFVAGTVATMVAGHLLGLPLWQGLVLGVVLVAGATFGDLAESLVKRQVGVKDSGALIPGHGGMLDRIDSLMFAGAIVYYFAIWIAH